MGLPFDTATPNTARMYDYWLGGKDNFAADRRAADAVRAIRPNVADQALDNKKFLTRAVRHVADHGVRQFIDVGAGLPTSPGATDGQPPAWLATHEAAAPGSIWELPRASCSPACCTSWMRRPRGAS